MILVLQVMPPNLITEANASGPRRLPMRTRRDARVAQFCRLASVGRSIGNSQPAGIRQETE
jgi:hypothetical protein